MATILRYSLDIISLVIFFTWNISTAVSNIGYHDLKFDNLEFGDANLITSQINVTSAIKCAMLCAENIACMSFFYNKEEQNCRIHGTAVYDLSQGTHSEGWLFYRYGENCPLHLGFIHDRDNKFCISISSDQLDADDAEQFCANFSSKLISLETADKQSRFDKFFAKIPKSTISSRIRIGLKYIGSQWTWSSGLPRTVNRMPPSSESVTSDCGGVTINKKDLWAWWSNSHLCKEQRAQSVCEKK